MGNDRNARNEWNVALACATAFALFLLTVGFGLANRRKVEQPDKVPIQTTNFRKQLNQTVDIARPLAPDLRVTELKYPALIAVDPGRPVDAGYLIEAANPNTYFFQSEEYELDDTIRVKMSDLNGLVSLLNTCYEKRNKFADILSKYKGKATLTIPIGTAKLEFNAEATADDLAETFGIINAIERIHPSRIVVAVKGFADGNQNPWTKAISKLPNKHHNFQVVDPSDRDNEVWLSYGPSMQSSLNYTKYGPKKQDFGNEELPDLRAEFIALNYVKPFLRSSSNRSVTETYVLHNKPIRHAEVTQQRRVEVYVLVYANVIRD